MGLTTFRPINSTSSWLLTMMATQMTIYPSSQPIQILKNWVSRSKQNPVIGVHPNFCRHGQMFHLTPKEDAETDSSPTASNATASPSNERAELPLPTTLDPGVQGYLHKVYLQWKSDMVQIALEEGATVLQLTACILRQLAVTHTVHVYIVNCPPHMVTAHAYIVNCPSWPCIDGMCHCCRVLP